MTEIPQESQHLILTAMENFPEVLRTCERFFSSGIPETMWNVLFKLAAQGVDTTGSMGKDGAFEAKKACSQPHT